MNKESKEKLSELMRKYLTEAYKEYLDYLDKNQKDSPIAISQDEILEVFCDIYNYNLGSPSVRLKNKEENNTP